MKKTLLTLAVVLAGYGSYAQSYLPLTAGSGNALTNTLYINNNTQTGAGLQLDGTAYGGHIWQFGDGFTTNGTFSIKDATAGLERLAITNTGNVGIGTTSPSQPLAIPITSNARGISLGTYSSLSAGQFAFVGITGADGTFNGGNLTGGDNGAASMAVIHTSGGAGNSAELAFVTHNNGVDSRERLRIDRLGNVGIGTTSPAYKLGLPNNATMSFNQDPTNPFGIEGGDHAQTRIIMGASSGASSNIAFGVSSGIGYVGFTERMRITAGGNLLIGKISQANTNYILDINGNARANEIVVNTTGADFVFEKNYKLPKLEEVEAYVNKNHHLSDIPTADAMKENGVAIGDMNTKLLKKVEELTLYLIEKDKQVTEQQKVTQSQQEQINQLKEQLNTITKALTKN